MNVTFTGKIIAAGQVQSGTSQNGTQWSSCEYVIEELNQQYPARAVIQVYGSDKLQQFNIQVGEIITAHIGLKAHQSKDGRWFNQLDCWKVQRPTAQPQQMQQGQVYASQVGQNYQQGAQQGFQQNPPQPAPIQQQAQYGGQQGNLPFPANN
ncbi:DUF3127 domain-containing protein [Segatella copri]|uniref:DUF3127 domain-containing protein n=1 Tax=Segatella copri TaxID=165179 RepID=UPI001C451451|nr:DUF3127 domain-containing protein [Segatella copri]MBW0024268.1 DUF3127 domain-containing protein [Segatella copri]